MTKIETQALAVGRFIKVMDRGLETGNCIYSPLPDFYAKDVKELIAYLDDWKLHDFYIVLLDDPEQEEFNIIRRPKL